MESVHTAGEQKKIPKWIDLQQIREREIGPMRTTSVTERVLILRRFEEVEEDPQRFEIRLKTNIKEGGREGSPREIETAGNSVRSRRLSARRSGGRRRAAGLRQRGDQGGSLHRRRRRKAASQFNKDRIAEHEGKSRLTGNSYLSEFFEMRGKPRVGSRQCNGQSFRLETGTCF